MQNLIIQFLHDINIGQLLVMGLMFWFFYSRLNDKIEKLDHKLSGRLEGLEKKIDNIDLRLHKVEWLMEMKFHMPHNDAEEK